MQAELLLRESIEYAEPVEHPTTRAYNPLKTQVESYRSDKLSHCPYSQGRVIYAVIIQVGLPPTTFPARGIICWRKGTAVIFSQSEGRCHEVGTHVQVQVPGACRCGDAGC